MNKVLLTLLALVMLQVSASAEVPRFQRDMQILCGARVNTGSSMYDLMSCMETVASKPSTFAEGWYKPVPCGQVYAIFSGNQSASLYQGKVLTYEQDRVLGMQMKNALVQLARTTKNALEQTPGGTTKKLTPELVKTFRYGD